MVKLRTPIHITPANPDGDVIIFGKGPNLESSDNEDGIARFGGLMRTPSYLIAYVRSAGILVNHGQQTKTLDDICLPAFYLQRHAVELLLKRLLYWIYEFAKFNKEFDQPSKNQLDRYTRSHNLSSLLNDLNKACKLYKFSSPPKQLGQLVREMRKYESNETWARYGTYIEKQDKQIKDHNQTEVIVPIVALQEALKNVVTEITFRFDGTETFERELYFAWEDVVINPRRGL